MQQASYHVFVFLLHSWTLECNSHNCHLCLRTEKKTRREETDHLPALHLEEGRARTRICWLRARSTVIYVSEQKLPYLSNLPALPTCWYIKFIHHQGYFTKFISIQRYKYMVVLSNSISGLGQWSNYSCSKGTTVVSDHILCGWHSSNNVLFDATFVSASYDFEVPVLRSITDCSTHDTEFQRISW